MDDSIFMNETLPTFANIGEPCTIGRCPAVMPEEWYEKHLRLIAALRRAEKHPSDTVTLGRALRAVTAHENSHK